MANQSKVASNNTLWSNLIFSLWKALTETKNRKLMSLASVIGILFLIKKYNNSNRYDSPNLKAS